MRKYWLIILLFSNISFLEAQPAIPDSIRYSLQNSPVDSYYVKRFIKAILYLPYRQPDSVLYFADSTHKLSQRLEYNLGIVYSYILMGEYYKYKGDYSRSIYYVYEILRLSEATGDINGILHGYGGSSAIYSELGDYRKALDYQLRIWEKASQVGFIIVNDWYTITVKNKKYFYDYNLGKAYLNMGMVDSALYYGDSAFLANSQWAAIPVLMGNIYLVKKDYTNALKYFNTVTTDNYTVDTVENYIGKASAFKLIPQLDSCKEFALKAFDIARRINYAKGILQASELLSFYYEYRDVNESLKYLRIGNGVRDSLYNAGRISQANSIVFNDELRRLDAIAAEKAARNRYKILSLLGIATTLLIIGILLWRNNLQKKKANVLLHHQKEKVESTLSELKQTQAQLIQSEKMASLGELTAGIAHEIQNPLNFVNNFSEINKELLGGIMDEVEKGNLSEIRNLAADLEQNMDKIEHHGKRADAIVKSMLQHSRISSWQKELTDINALVKEYIQLAWYGMRARDNSFNIKLETHLDPSMDKLNIIPQEIGRVLLNLLNNAFYAVNEKKNFRMQADGADEFEPRIIISTQKFDGRIEIRVKDNGLGIEENLKEKVFQPFFTTKPTGQGTGLGLSLSYNIIKAHSGELKLETREGEMTEFIILLPT